MATGAARIVRRMAVRDLTDVERAASYEGFLGIEPARNADGTGVAAVYFTDAEAIAAWARDPEHRVAKKRGREEWYRHYMIRICKVEREYGRPDA